MTKAETLRHLDECIALSKGGPPITGPEEREHLRRCAEEDARAENRRKPTPQLPFDQLH